MKLSITRISALALTLFVSSSLGLAQTSSSARLRTTDRTSTSKTAGSKVTPDVIENDLKEALAVVENNYVGGSKLNYNDVFNSTMDSMLHTLDPHSNYFDPKESEEFMNEQSSRYYGIGATIGDLRNPDGDVIATYIKATFDGSPAQRAGLRYGDKIIEVDAKSMIGKPSADVRGSLRGPAGTVAKITVERMGTGKIDKVEIIRGAIPQPSISEVYMIRPGVGYMAMRGGFNQTTYGEFVRGLQTLKAEGATQLLLDLRENGGGLVSQAKNIANTLLSYGQTIYTQRGRVRGINEVHYADNKAPDRSPIVVLVNRNTASASEILAGALQDHDRALIAGETTFGKGLVQSPFQMDNGGILLLTIAKYQTPSGRLIQRDYSNGDLYSYYSEGGSLRSDSAPVVPKGPESKTDTGRPVYSGGGITPDVNVKPEELTVERIKLENKLASPIFAFAMQAVQGKVAGFESYKIDRAIQYDYDIKPSDYPVTDPLYQAFKKFAEQKYKIAAPLVDREREFVERILRTEFITAAYGSTTSGQVFNNYDDQLQKSLDLMPQAKQLAMTSEKLRLSGQVDRGN